MKFDLVVIGAGPAGISAAIKARKNGAHVLIVDENPVAGGKLLGQLYEVPDKGWWIGQRIAEKLVDQATSIGVQFLQETEAWGIFPGWKVVLENSETIDTSYVLIATGAAEKALPIPGWTKPGVIAIGAAQVLTNYHRVKPGKRVAIIGVDPLSLSIAQELQLAGVEVVGIYLPPINPFSQEKADPHYLLTNLAKMSHLAPNQLLKTAGKMLHNPFVKKLAAKWYPANGLKIGNIPLYLRKRVMEIGGETEVDHIRVAPINRNGGTVLDDSIPVEVDCVCLSGGLYPLSELAGSVGCKMVTIKELGGTIPLYSPEMETTQSGLFVAGNITGIEGAKVAMAQGNLAATAISSRLGLLENPSSALEQAISEVEKERKNAILTFMPQVEEGREKVTTMWKTT
ncbi:NAD(P)/FAD-dependent oxidoreductase [Oceanobacillus halotolerans]|uniref:NAD(P)/FAD-dependent oxidoreductase n=1 Tax=Oceanobacillus halotolerans TaxID=2663380 RepID=UPI0013DBB84F|nr:FAD-dependent oxidoreductase [Oceanobacillus halotolerans]